MPLTAIVLAAGEGTRMKSKHPKVMHEMLGRPLVWWSIRAARQAGATKIVLVVGSGAEELRSYFADDTDITFVEQTMRLGTGHAVQSALAHMDTLEGPCIILYGDSPLITKETILDLCDAAKNNDAACTLLTMRPDDPFGYGRVKTDKAGHVLAIVEEKDCTDEERKIKLANAGFYCFDGKVLSETIGKLTNDNAQGEYYLTDMVYVLQDAGYSTLAVEVADAEDVLGVNSRSQLAVATKIMQRRINEEHMAAGVTLWDPNTTWIGPEVTLAQDVEILPNCMLLGKTVVDEDAVIGPNTRLIDAKVGKAARVDESILVDSQVDEETNVGPRAYLRGGAHLLRKAKAGTHVELKGSTVGVGSKVPHLSYIGDATLGANVNIGGGTITCNYDGKHKSKTTIGDHVFVGSDTMLVAPVTIGDDALIGAASCITKDVPAGALALERNQQTIIENWATQYWKKLEEED